MVAILYFLIQYLVLVWRDYSVKLSHRLFTDKQSHAFGQKKVSQLTASCSRFQKKPDWVIKEIIHMKACMPEQGCRKIADCFNRRFSNSKKMTVGKTFVSHTITKHLYEIQILQKNIKHRVPEAMSINQVWGMDLTGKTDSQGKTHNLFGVVDHGSRACLCLSAVKDKSTLTLLRYLLDAIEKHGKPKIIRTDNEGCFTSKLLSIALWLLNIKHQRIDKGCPWMNGRVERFFGTLKERLNHWQVDSPHQLNGALFQFRFWYNHVRPHQHLQGRTPAEVWQGRDIYTQPIKEECFFTAWDGLLRGYYLQL